MDKHTPGPWVYEGPRNSIIVWADDGESRICFMTSDGPAEANARLIAAAPDLLKALKEAVYVAHAYDEHPGWLDAARAAIAKAEGTDQ